MSYKTKTNVFTRIHKSQSLISTAAVFCLFTLLEAGDVVVLQCHFNKRLMPALSAGYVDETVHRDLTATCEKVRGKEVMLRRTQRFSKIYHY